jgi:hypothetical protein
LRSADTFLAKVPLTIVRGYIQVAGDNVLRFHVLGDLGKQGMTFHLSEVYEISREIAWAVFEIISCQEQRSTEHYGCQASCFIHDPKIGPGGCYMADLIFSVFHQTLYPVEQLSHPRAIRLLPYPF